MAIWVKLIICYLFWLFSAKALSQTPTRIEGNIDALTPEKVPGTIVLSRFKVIGNRVIPQSAIAPILKSYLYRPISFASLLELQEKLTQLYIERGYLTSGAYIPPQTIKNRTVRIKIIEGKLAEIKIRGLKDLREKYIRSRLAIATQAPLKQDKLLNALQLLQLDPLIANISAELSQGINPGESWLEVEVEEATSFTTELSLDNYRNLSVGSFGRRVSLNEQNLLGFGDRFSVAYLNTEGSNTLDNLSYVVPVGANNGEVSLVHARSNSTIVSEPFEEIDLGSANRYYEASYRQPLYQTPEREFSWGISFNRQNTQLSLMDTGFPTLARGSDIEGITEISALRFFQEYSDRDLESVFALRSQFSIGLDVFEPTINPDGIPDSKFLVWRGQGQYLRLLSPRTKILLRGDLQLADRGLLSAEQFTAGGIASVRGYRQERILADNGFFFSGELQNTLWQTSDKLSLELSPFFDFAQVWSSDDLALDISTLASVGLGLQLTAGDSFTARIDWGIPLLKDTGFEGGSLQENGIYFSLTTQPF